LYAAPGLALVTTLTTLTTLDTLTA